MSLLSLPDELLRLVMTLLDNEYRDSPSEEPSPCLLTICRRLTPIVEPIILREVTITTLHSLSSFARFVRGRLFGSSSDTKQRRGDFVRILYLYSDCKGSFNPSEAFARWSSLLVITLLSLPHLEELMDEDHCWTQAFAACLTQSAGRNVSNLSIMLAFDAWQSEGIFTHINEMHALRRLDLTLIQEEPLTPEHLEVEENLNLPSVVHFGWVAHMDDETSQTVANRYLARCRFNMACSVGLYLFRMPEASACHLMSFFDAHQFSALTLDTTTHACAVLASRLATIQHVDLRCVPPPLELLHAERLPAALTVQASAAENGLHDLQHFLRSIPGRAARLGGPTKLFITTTPYQRQFSWDDFNSAESAEFINIVKIEAMRLYDEEVFILDKQGRDIKSVVGSCGTITDA